MASQWRLSIPPWFDCGVAGHAACPLLGLLSIPPWFDCGIRLRPPWGDPPPSFNPTLVRLRHVCDLACSRWGPAFNPTLVRLRHGEVLDPARAMDVFSFNPTLVRLRRCEG